MTDTVKPKIPEWIKVLNEICEKIEKDKKLLKDNRILNDK